VKPDKSRVKFNLQSCLLAGVIFALLALPAFAQAGKAEQAPALPRVAYDVRAWKEFESAEGGFTVALPGKPGLTVHTVEALAGPLANHVHGLDIGVAVFAVTYTDMPFPVPAGDKEAINRAFDAGKARALAGAGGQLISEESISLEGYMGRAVFYRDRDGALTHNRSYIVGNRLYQVMVVSDDYRQSPAEDRRFFKDLIDRFFASFKLTRKAY
jgi:hypothetical protein